MKTKLFESTLWKSAFFVYGLVAIGLSVMSFLMSFETEVPSISELSVLTGTIYEIEHRQTKNDSWYRLSLKLDQGNKRFNISRCEHLLNLGKDSRQKIFPNDVVSVLVDKANPFAIVDGSIWQVEKNGVLVCPYDRVVANQIRSDEFGIKLSVFLLILGLLLSTIGIIRTRQGESQHETSAPASAVP
ncbi:MAG: hypothetical protein BECKG1743D_GA0114223_100573 [Candidatus Kentron sp. G]|nr:MAG: hypothetical protein BECKG1743F_GA0114225_100553 [Candidatus Kentron sp. G]VFM96339.1 MAG: hypothetical protein BECKG1743E_GA0114224_100513 [Candidatus Kentron sp. G]VFM98337.1 MAG: hypothetical protein BECKG1743D_GA0114223_100573 [Candidatus Kentron sp. G]